MRKIESNTNDLGMRLNTYLSPDSLMPRKVFEHSEIMTKYRQRAGSLLLCLTGEVRLIQPVIPDSWNSVLSFMLPYLHVRLIV